MFKNCILDPDGFDYGNYKLNTRHCEIRLHNRISSQKSAWKRYFRIFHKMSKNIIPVPPPPSLAAAKSTMVWFGSLVPAYPGFLWKVAVRRCCMISNVFVHERAEFAPRWYNLMVGRSYTSCSGSAQWRAILMWHFRPSVRSFVCPSVTYCVQTMAHIVKIFFSIWYGEVPIFLADLRPYARPVWPTVAI